MKKYYRAKKYLRFIIPAVIIIGAIIVPKAHHKSNADTLGIRTAAHTPLSVSQTGNKMYTDVTADSLQPAAAPDRSATSAGLNPQPAVPNYCSAGEVPYIDGCIARP